MDTSLSSALKPISFLLTSFAIIQSQFFEFSFFKELISKSFVSAENPITILGRKELCLET